MVRKDCQQMKTAWCKTTMQVLFSLLIGVMVGASLGELLQAESALEQLFGYVLVLLLAPFVYQSSTNYVANEMVRDKETKMKETLKIMGLKPWIYSLSFLVQQGLWLIIPCFSMTITIYLFCSEVIDAADMAAIFFSLWFYSLGMLSLTMVLSNFFSNSKLVNMVLNVILFIPTGIAMTAIIAPGQTGIANEWIQYMFWIPNFPWTVIFINTIKTTPFEYFTATNEVAWVCLVVQVPIWFLIHLYLEAILPDNYGISKPCCFCCTKSKPIDEEDAVTGEDQVDVAEQQPRLKRVGTERMDKGDPIQLQRVTMKFGEFKAVDNLSLSIKQNEIMAVLGHNGAGKTTAIYMLTGMLHMTSGDATIHGMSVKKDIDAVRRNIGLCQQLDVLYDNLSVREHLVLTYRIRKGSVAAATMNEQIESILTRTQMTEHQDKLVKQCSGGMKRKLSLGMALIGETQTIILDEPTSGLDVESREQMWALIRQLKEERSIIMSTQHIEEADELADRVCIMSHGRIVGLDTPNGIKHKFGVGYIIFIEAKHQYENQLDQNGLNEMFNKVRAIFIGQQGMEGIEESPDSNDKKLIILVPSTYVHQLSSLIEQVESTVQQAQIDIELNSLEDAFIKIAESDIREEEQQIKELAQKELHMTEEEEKKALQDYFDYEGRQNCCQKMFVIFLHRLQNYYRSTTQWVANLLPLVFVAIMLFVLNSILRASAPEEGTNNIETTGEDTGGRDDRAYYLEEIVPMVMKYWFAGVIIISYSITAGMSAVLPLKEKKGGLRHMMRLFGLGPFEYWFAMFVADFIIVLIPAFVASIALTGFDEMMERKAIPEFFCDFVLFITAINCLSYLFSHAFSDPDSAIKNLSLIYIFGFFIGPLVATLILSAVIDFENVFSSALEFWFFFSPFYTFLVYTLNICIRDVEMLQDTVFKVGADDTVVDLKIAAGVYAYQIIVIFATVVLIDWLISRRYKKADTHAPGELPPILPIHQDVTDHEDQVRQAGGLSENDPEYLQVRAVDLCKTYSGAKQMAVCKNTFGVKKGEVYGLLGPNGAGKSTTFGMMAMQFSVTSGEPELMGQSLSTLDLSKNGKFFGICNQENLIWDEMTVDESLNLVASLRGISGLRRDIFKRIITQNLDLTPFKNTLSKNLSGGNKRKLCCAQALMHSPKVLFLDEPTCGVDPVSRRSLNRMIKKMKQASVLLTTHRMDEAEQLCDKIAIMINGRFVVCGSPNYLKNQYGHGYTVTIRQASEKFNDQNSNILAIIQQQIPTALLVHTDGEQGEQTQAATIESRFKIVGINAADQTGQVNLSLSSTFRQCAQLLERDLIKDFTLTRTTMGEVFTDFAKFQIDAAATGKASAAPIPAAAFSAQATKQQQVDIVQPAAESPQVIEEIRN